MLPNVHNAHFSVKSKRTSNACFMHIMSYDDRPDPAKRLEQARIARGFETAKAAAEFFGWKYDSYIQHESGTRGIPRAAARYAKAFRVREGWLLTGEGEGPDGSPLTVEIAGKAGAGPDGAVVFGTGDGSLGEVPAPIGATVNTRALEVQGDSMRGLANDGWLVFYDEKEPPRLEHMGEPCVCFLEDERVLIKTPHPGSSRGLFHLESFNAPIMLDVPVRYFALVTDIKPRRSANKHLSKDISHHFDEVTVEGNRITR